MRHAAGDARVKVGCFVMALFAGPLVAGTIETIPAPAATSADTAKPRDPARPDAGKKRADTDQRPDARDGRCDVCGSCECVRTVCVPKPKEREIKKTCWSYTCEEFCVPGPSEYCGRHDGKPDECGCWSFDAWRPTCAAVRTKKVPVKTEVKRKVPGVEWSPEERCAACRCLKPDAVR